MNSINYKPMTSDCYGYYSFVTFTLVKETPKGLRIRLEGHPEKISIWMPKKGTRGPRFNHTYKSTAYFWNTALFGNIRKEESVIRDKKYRLENRKKEILNED